MEKRLRQARGEEDIPWRPVLTALLLFFIGSIFWPLGIYTIFSDYDKGVALISIGVITFIPGSFATFYFVQAFRGAPGWKYKHMPGQHQE